MAGVGYESLDGCPPDPLPLDYFDGPSQDHDVLYHDVDSNKSELPVAIPLLN